MNTSKLTNLGLALCLAFTAACSGGGGGSKPGPSTDVTIEEFKEMTLDQKVEHISSGMQSLVSRGLLAEDVYDTWVPDNISQEQLTQIDSELGDLISKSEIAIEEAKSSGTPREELFHMEMDLITLQSLRNSVQSRLNSNGLSPSTSYY